MASEEEIRREIAKNKAEIRIAELELRNLELNRRLREVTKDGGKKRKRNDKGKGKEKEKDQAGPPPRRSRSKKRKKRADPFAEPLTINAEEAARRPTKGSWTHFVVVENPETGNPIRVSDVGSTQTRFYKYARAAFKEATYDKDGKLLAPGHGPASKLLVRVLKAAMYKGMRFRDPKRVPTWAVERARDKLQRELTPEEFDEKVATDPEADSLIDRWTDSFKVYRAVSPEWREPEGYAEDMLKAKQQVRASGG